MAVANVGGFNYQFGMEMPSHLEDVVQEFASDIDKRIYEKSRGIFKPVLQSAEERLDAQRFLEQALQMRKEARYAEGLECLRKSANLGNGRAMWELGCAHASDGDWGLNIDNPIEYQKMFLQSAEAGYPAGLAFASRYFAVGVDDPRKRIFVKTMLAAMALATNDPFAVAYCNQYGLGVPRNVDFAWQLYREAAIQGVSEAAIKMGAIKQAAGEPENAIDWFKMAAEQGRSFGHYMVGKSFYLGNGLAHDLQGAFSNFSKASLGNIQFGASELINIEYNLLNNKVSGAKRVVLLSNFFSKSSDLGGMDDFGLKFFAMREHLTLMWKSRLEVNLLTITQNAEDDGNLRELYQLGKGLVEMEPDEKDIYVEASHEEAYGDKYPEIIYQDSRKNAQKAASSIVGIRSKRPGTLLSLLPKDVCVMLAKMIWESRENPGPWLQKSAKNK